MLVPAFADFFIFIAAFFLVLLVLRGKSLLLSWFELGSAVGVIASVTKMTALILLPVATDYCLVFVRVRGCHTSRSFLTCLEAQFLLAFSSLQAITLSDFRWLVCGIYRGILRSDARIINSASFLNLFMIRSCSILSLSAHKIVRAGTNTSLCFCGDFVLNLALLTNFGFDIQVPAVLCLSTPIAIVFSAWTSLRSVARESTGLVSFFLGATECRCARVSLRCLRNLFADRLFSRRWIAHIDVFFACNLAAPFVLVW